MSKLLSILALMGSCQVGQPQTPAVPVAPPAPSIAAKPRTIVVISDLHFGLGKDSHGEWDHFEDFRWSSELSRFLNRIDSEGQGATDLILNGDTFELWQSRSGDCADPDPSIGCSEEAALGRMRAILKAHAGDLKMLGRFALQGDNRVVVVPGNHDGALLFSRVAAEVETALAAPGRATISRTGFWLSADSRVYTDHGHQLAIDPNRFQNWPVPFVTRGGTRYISRPWGEGFVRLFYDRFEDRYPTIDNVSSEAAAIGLAVAREGNSGVFKATGSFLGFTLLKTSWSQKSELLGQSDEPPAWNLTKVRAAGGRAFLLDSVPTEDPLRFFIEESFRSGADPLKDLGDNDILGICDGRWATNLQAQRRGKPPLFQECPKQGASMGASEAEDPENRNMGSLSNRILRSRTAIFGGYLRESITALRSSGPQREALLAKPFDLYVYSHTHSLENVWSVRAHNHAIRVVNTGAFQRVASPQWIEKELKRRGLAKRDALAAIPLEQFPACYGVVRIPPYGTAEGPQPLVGYWSVRPGNANFALSCE